MFHLKFYRSFIAPKARSSFISSLLIENRMPLQHIYQHPFNQQLFAGSLEQSIFGHYLRDDFLYLHEFSFAIQNIAKRTTSINPKLSRQLSTLAHEVIAGEQDMQLKYAVHFNHPEHRMGATVTEYSKYLINSSLNKDIPYALCSILPCFWIYYQLGVMNRSSKSILKNPYHDWIATYTSPEFIKVTKELAATIELIAQSSDVTDWMKMNTFFSKSTEFELRFFNEVYFHPITGYQRVESHKRHSF